MHEVELYDLDEDPGSSRDVLEGHEDVAQRLRSALIQWLLSVQDRGWGRTVEVDAATLLELQGMGYAGTATSAEGVWWAGESCECTHCEPFDN